MELFSGKRLDEKHFALSGSELHHCIRVTRHRLGDKILITDFQGTIYNALISDSNSDTLTLQILGVYKVEYPTQAKISIAISLTQPADRFEWFIEKAVENGIHEIIPIECTRTENSKFKKDRCLKIIESSAKQTLRPYKPLLHDLCTFGNAIKSFSDYPQKYFGHCQQEELPYLGKLYHPQQAVIVYIGPAGDFTQEEISLARTNNVVPVSLGSYRLRTETAGLTSLLILQTIKHL